LWTSDGTPAGTYRLTPAGVRCQGPLSAPVTRLGSRVFFSAWFPPSGTEPWVTDGTPAGTRLLADLNPGRGGSNPGDFTVFAGKAWLTALRHLWKSDGTAKGTVAVGPELQDLHPRTTYGGRLWFTGLNGAGLTELWATDGTAARTERIATLRTVGSLTVHAGRLWFLGNGSGLWSTDGTAAGTRRLVDLPGSAFGSLLSDGARLYLTDASSALWVSDGTAAGTRKISDVGIQNGSSIAFAGRLYYASSEGAFYTSDGTAAGTRPVRSDGEPRGATSLLRLGDRLVAVDGHRALWRSDGTAEGTQRLTQPDEYRVGEIVKAGPHLFFAGWDAATGTELWAMHE
jgi:ELWxxDGT repeat protein